MSVRTPCRVKHFFWTPTRFNKREIPGPLVPSAGDQFGASIAVDNYSARLVVGAPGTSNPTHFGSAYFYTLSEDGPPSPTGALCRCGLGELVGASLAIGSNTTLVGAPGAGAGAVQIVTSDSSGIPSRFDNVILHASDGALGDQFGQFVAVSGNTAVVGAGGNDEKGADAGAAYVFVRDSTGQWKQQQSLQPTTRAGDLFGYNAVAIQAMIVVGAFPGWGHSSSTTITRVQLMMFTRNATVWTQQTKLSASAFVPRRFLRDNVSIARYRDGRRSACRSFRWPPRIQARPMPTPRLCPAISATS